MLEIGALDLDDIATALGDQDPYDEHRYLIDPATGEIVFWTSEDGTDLDEADLIPISALPSRVWYQDMADFVARVSDERVARRLARAIDGRGAFGRFKVDLHEEYPELLPYWYAFRDTRAGRRAVEWLLGNGLVSEDAAHQYLADNPDPDVP